FFFSSRRRHTRLVSDWSSDVCSSDLALVIMNSETAKQRNVRSMARVLAHAVTGVDPMVMGIGPISAVTKVLQRANLSIGQVDLRSEERRGGKRGRAGWGE